MNIISNLIDSTPILGHTKAGFHYLAGENEKGNKALYKSTKTTAVIAGGAVGSMLGPGGVVAGSVYAGALSDTFASIAMDEPQRIVKHGENGGKDVKHHKNPCESLLRTGVQIGLHAVGGAGINGVSTSNVDSFCEAISTVGYSTISTVGYQILKPSVKMLRKTFS